MPFIIGSRKTIIGGMIIVAATAGLLMGHVDQDTYKELILATLAIFSVANYSERVKNENTSNTSSNTGDSPS